MYLRSYIVVTIYVKTSEGHLNSLQTMYFAYDVAIMTGTGECFLISYFYSFKTDIPINKMFTVLFHKNIFLSPQNEYVRFQVSPLCHCTVNPHDTAFQLHLYKACVIIF